MGLITSKKKLFEYEPQELDLDSLNELQTSLIAKLFLVNQELILRYKNITDLDPDLPQSDDAIALIAASMDHLEKVNAFLQAEIARLTGKMN
jgi:hypothetical protein